VLYIVPDCSQLYLDVTCKVVNRSDIIIVGELRGAEPQVVIGEAVVVGHLREAILLDLPIKGTPPIVRQNDIKLIALFKELRFRTTLSH